MAQTVKQILKINSSGRSDGSVSRQLVQRAIDRLITAHPEAAVIERDVSSGLPVVDETWIGANFTPGEARTPEQEQKLEFSDELIGELRAADVIVIGVPIYNFGVPASLKQWVDLIARAGETFSYSESGPKGLLEGKRAIVAVASGGAETGSPADFASTYMKFVLGFVGITDVTIVSANGLAMDAEAPIKAANDEIDSLLLAAA